MPQDVESHLVQKLRSWFETPLAALKTFTWVSFAGLLAGVFGLLILIVLGGVFGFFDN